MRTQRFIKWLYKLKLGQRLALYLMLVSIGFTVVTLGIQVIFQHHYDKIDAFNKTNTSIDTVEEQLTLSLWRVDEDSVRLLLEGIYRLPFISAVELKDPVSGSYSYGEITEENIKRELIYENKPIGYLTVSISLLGPFEKITETLKTFLGGTVIIFILIGLTFNFIVNQVVTHHLKKIASTTRSSQFHDKSHYYPIILDRPPINDELTDLVDELNSSQHKNIEHSRAQNIYEKKLAQQANRDSLTGLPNRNHANSYLIRYCARKENNDQILAILFIDLDGFKEINDSLGHSIGDQILKESARRFNTLVLAEGGYIARFGGDEFIAIIEYTSDQTADEFSKKIIGTLEEPFFIDNNHLTMSCSIGVVYSPPEECDPEELVRKADIAMYKAKEAGRNRYVVFHPNMTDSIIQETTIKNKLQEAMQNDILTIHYQPLVNINTKKIIGFEALLRWTDKEQGYIRPDIFIPIAEKAGITFPLDTWVFSKAVKDVEHWREISGEDYIVSINFSPSNFINKNLISWLETDRIFQKNLDWVEVEVTERLMLENDMSVLDNLERMLNIGISFSIDDFGTGYSSLGYIKKFNHALSKIKIDRLFVNELINEDSSRALVKSIVTMANSLSIEVLAEGVETEEQETILASLGCNYAQGYYYAKPLPKDEIDKIVTGHYLPGKKFLGPNSELNR